MKHEGFSKHRLHPDADNVREVQFAEAWVEENKVRGTLQHLIPRCEERDAQVAATIIQWLGSNVGNSFLSKVIDGSPEIRKSLDIE